MQEGERTMKHNTHIYIATKAMELMTESVSNLKKGRNYYKGSEKTKQRNSMKKLQRLLNYHKSFINEATWAPDDILKDMRQFHTFKLFTDDEFPDHQLHDKQQFKKYGKVYYRWTGGLVFKVDHLAQIISDMGKLRNYNDQFSQKQLMYLYMLLSHYITDAHVPMHCDVRDDSPKRKLQGEYMKSSAHGDLEGLWEDAVLPVVIKEEIVFQTRSDQSIEETEYSKAIKFRLSDCARGGSIAPVHIKKGKLMDFVVNICIDSKKRGLRLFPIDNPKERNDSILPEMTREIFSDAISDLISIWRYIWINSEDED